MASFDRMIKIITTSRRDVLNEEVSNCYSIAYCHNVSGQHAVACLLFYLVYLLPITQNRRPTNKAVQYSEMNIYSYSSMACPFNYLSLCLPLSLFPLLTFIGVFGRTIVAPKSKLGTRNIDTVLLLTKDLIAAPN